jgi:hypothetical protein
VPRKGVRPAGKQEPKAAAAPTAAAEAREMSVGIQKNPSEARLLAEAGEMSVGIKKPSEARLPAEARELLVGNRKNTRVSKTPC